ncbi:MAG: PKD domain-containing protein [Candidatus Bathyarchaeia archaeon]
MKKIEKKSIIVSFLTLIATVSMVSFNGIVMRANSLELPTQYPLVYVYPENITVGVGDYFTISVVVYNLTNIKVQDPENPTQWIPLGNLYGFDIQFSWDPTIIKYVNYTVTVPVNNYSNPVPPSPYPGILYNPYVEVKNLVDEAGNIPGAADPRVRAWFSYASMAPAPAFNGNGTIFTMTFQAIKRGSSLLEIVDCTLADSFGDAIAKHKCTQYGGQWLIPPRNGEVDVGAPPKADFTFWPDIGVVNLPITFTAIVIGNTSNIQEYIWDFGDGTQETVPQPIILHTYTTPSFEYGVSLKVRDAEGVESRPVTRKITVVQSRDLKATAITLSQKAVKPNSLFSITAAIENMGTAPFTFVENCTLEIYRNNTFVDPNNPADLDPLNSKWTIIKSKWTLLTAPYPPPQHPSPTTITISLNSTTAFGEYTTETFYYFLLRLVGVPEGYEADQTNNIAVSDYIMYTIHDIVILKIASVDYGYEIGRTYKRPLIEGENATFKCTIINQGVITANFTVILRLNDTIVGTIEIFNLESGTSSTSSFRRKIESRGNYNVSINIASENEGIIADMWQGWLIVIKPPIINVTVSNQNPTVGQTVTFEASVNVQEPNTNITLYGWKVYKPDVDPESGSAFKTFWGNTTLSFSFDEPGKWTVTFEVSDSLGLKYDPRRPATKAYRVLLSISVGGGGFPVEWILAIMLVIIIAVALIVYKRRKKKVFPISEEEE